MNEYLASHLFMIEVDLGMYVTQRECIVGLMNNFIVSCFLCLKRIDCQ